MPEPRFLPDSKQDGPTPVLEQVKVDKEIFLAFARKYDAEKIAMEVFESLDDTDEFENIGRDLDNRVQNFGGAFFFQIFLERTRVQINSAEAKDIDGKDVNFTDRKSLHSYLSTQANTMDLFLSAIDNDNRLNPLQKSRFTAKLRELSRDALFGGDEITIDGIENAIMEVGNNIYIDECYPEDLK